MTDAAISRWRIVMDTLVSTSVIVVALTAVWVFIRGPNGQHVAPERSAVNRSTTRVVTAPVSIDGAHIKGNHQARAVLIVFSEFQCPYCAEFATNALPHLDQLYVKSGRVAVVFRHFPLESIHRFAVDAARNAQCAGRQNRFWEAHDLLFAEQGGVTRGIIPDIAHRLNLDATLFRKCVDDADTLTRLRVDIREGKRLGVTGTPTLFVGTRQPDGLVLLSSRFVGAKSLRDVQAALDSLLEQD